METGKYKDICSEVMEKVGAAGVVLIIIDGNDGSGVAMQASRPDVASMFPKILVRAAQQITPKPD